MIIKSESKQTTISKKVSLKGVGLHTGLEVEVNFLPANIDNGYTFRRIDLEGLPIIHADANLVTNTQRGTCLEKNGVIIQTCEHVLAALVGLEIDNVIIELSTSSYSINFLSLFIGFFTSCFVAFLTIKYFLIFVNKIGMYPFVIYRIILGIMLLILV